MKEKIIDLVWKYWFDRKITSNLLTEPKIDFIYLPFNRGKVFIDIYIRAGFLLEDQDRSGIGHLLEHYLASNIRDHFGNKVDFTAQINNDFIYFSLAGDNKKDFQEEIEPFLEKIFTPSFDSELKFNYEKQSIFNETNIEKHDLQRAFFRLMVKNRYVDEINKRSFVDQMPTLEKITPEQIREYWKEIFITKNVQIFVSGSKMNKNLTSQVVSKMKSFCLVDERMKDFPEPIYSGQKIIIEKENDIEGLYTAISLPALNGKSTIKERRTLGMITEILGGFDEHTGGYRFVRQVGIYDFSVDFDIGMKNGFFWVKSYLTENQLEQWLEVINTSFIKFKNNEIKPETVEEIRNRWIKNARNSWRNNQGRFDKISGRILYGDQIENWGQIEDSINSITVEDLTKMAQRVFNRQEINIVVMGETQNIDAEKINKKIVF